MQANYYREESISLGVYPQLTVAAFPWEWPVSQALQPLHHQANPQSLGTEPDQSLRSPVTRGAAISVPAKTHPAQPATPSFLQAASVDDQQIQYRGYRNFVLCKISTQKLKQFFELSFLTTTSFSFFKNLPPQLLQAIE